MNIETNNVNNQKNIQNINTQQNNSENSVKFCDELKELERNQKTEPVESFNKSEDKTDKNKEGDSTKNDKKFDFAIDDLNSVVKALSQSDEKTSNPLKQKEFFTDDNKKGETLINKDYSIQENKDLMPQMNPNMNFSGDGQPFSSFMNNEQQGQNKNLQLGHNKKDLAEEAAILSTMAENIAIANLNSHEEIKTINSPDGIKKIETKTNNVTENIVKYNSIIMNQADVEVFAQLVQNNEININNLAPEATKQSMHISKTLADMLAKSMETGQPLRIDFDNNISVIIKISRDGKISADFLPSSQVAEAYLKENLPLLRQKFDDNNIKYDELNQKERRENREQNRKKGRDNE